MLVHSSPAEKIFQHAGTTFADTQGTHKRYESRQRIVHCLRARCRGTQTDRCDESARISRTGERELSVSALGIDGPGRLSPGFGARRSAGRLRHFANAVRAVKLCHARRPADRMSCTLPRLPQGVHAKTLLSSTRKDTASLRCGEVRPYLLSSAQRRRQSLSGARTCHLGVAESEYHDASVPKTSTYDILLFARETGDAAQRRATAALGPFVSWHST